MRIPRSSGIVLPISSLPGPYGIGTLGSHARLFVDFLRSASQTWWQVLPLTPTGYGDSPYQSPSSFAGNPNLIDLVDLCERGLLTEKECLACDFGDDPDYVDFGKLYEGRLPLLRRAFARRNAALSHQLDAFRNDHRGWLRDFAFFMAAKERFGMVALDDWPSEGLRVRHPKALREWEAVLDEDICFQEFLQFLFFTQWNALKAYANGRGVRIIGDMPIYVSSDSVERWTQPSLFLLDKNGAPSVVAGVPPDCFSETGQLWGNPLYDWAYHTQTGFAWWLSRLEHMGGCFDMIRIDHFLGFHHYYAVPADHVTAENGRYHPGPGMAFVDALRGAFPRLALIAEDLGNLDDRSIAFFRETGFPGMNVLVHAFDTEADNRYLPHNAAPDRVLYTSTHDSPTFLDWLVNEATPAEQAFATAYMLLSNREGLSWGAIRSVWASSAGLAMAQLQDALGLGADARINIPSTLGGNNWRWRARVEAFNPTVASRLADLTRIYRRTDTWRRRNEAKVASLDN